MVIDLSEKGKEEFYTSWFKETQNIIKSDKIDGESKYKLLSQYIENLKLYESQRKMYKEQLNILWNIKKHQLIISASEKEVLEVNSIETIKREESIKKQTELLKKLSKTFESDLEEIIFRDPDVRKFKIRLN